MKQTAAIVATWLFVILTACSHMPPAEDRGAATGGAVAPPSVQTATTTALTFTKPVSFSILQDYVKGNDLREVEEDFKLMKELGVSTWRGSFAWGDLEPTRGNYDLDWLKQFVDLAGREGMKLQPYIGYTPQWAAKGGTDKEHWNDPPRRLQDWTEFVSTVVTTFKDNKNILSYEIYNEENVKQWWDGTAADYNAVLRSASSAVRVISPDKRVIFGGMVYPDDKWMHQACVTYNNSTSFDVIPIHAYPETWTPANITLENYLDQGYAGHFQNYFIPLVDKECGRKPIWINEMGFANTPGKSEQTQANWWARAFATFLANPRVEHLGIYQIKERVKGTSVIGGQENYYLGITYPDRRKKMAFHTIKALVALLDTGKLTVADKELKSSVTVGKKGELYQHLFVRPDGRQVLFVWDKKESPTLRIKVRPGSEAWEHGLDGTAVDFKSFNGQVLEGVKLKPGQVRIFEIRP